MDKPIFNTPQEYQHYRWYKLYMPITCCICGNPFNPFSDVYYGRNENGEIKSVCDNCKSRLQSISHNESFSAPQNIPDPQTNLWRYMDLAKFISLLSSRKLYLTRLDNFSDKYEGALCSREGFSNFKQKDEFTRRLIETVKLKKRGIENPTPEEIEFEMRKSREQSDKNRELNRKQTFVYCWSANDVESEAMWRLYSKDMTCGVAVHTTFEKLFWSLPYNSNADIRHVEYVNYDCNFYAYTNPEWYKRKSLNYENEVRIVIRNATNAPIEYAKQIEVNLDTLIQDVVTSPEAEMWFTELVAEICNKYNVNCDVRPSEIKTAIYY